MVLIFGLAPLIGPGHRRLADRRLGWRSTFYFLTIAPGAAVALGAYAFMPETRGKNHPQSGETAMQAYGAVLGNWPLMRSSLIVAFGTACLLSFIATSPQLLINVMHIPAGAIGLFLPASRGRADRELSDQSLSARAFSAGSARWRRDFCRVLRPASHLWIVAPMLATLGVWAILAPICIIMGTLTIVNTNSNCDSARSRPWPRRLGRGDHRIDGVRIGLGRGDDIRCCF